jgi:hypothetical protein
MSTIAQGAEGLAALLYDIAIEYQAIFYNISPGAT